jgi:hypothetical protein
MVEAFVPVSFARTLVVLLLALGLGAYLWLVEEPKAVLEAKGDVLADFEPADIEKVRFAYPDGGEIVVVREGEKWKMTVPVASDADGANIENFLNTVRETKIERRLKKDEAGALSSYGLDAETGSQGRLELTKKGGTPLPAMVLGIATPVGYQAFARREGDEDVFLIPLLLQSSVRKTPFDLRVKTLFPEVDSTGIEHVTIRRAGAEPIELEHISEFRWDLRSPIKDAADLESVRSMLDSVATIDALAFFDGDEADRKAFGLDETGTKFTAKRKDGSSVEFTLGKEAADQPAGFYLERSSDGQVAKVPDWTVKKFAPDPNELRQKRLVPCRIDEVLSMTWQPPGGDAFTISREAADRPWKIDPAVEGEVLNQAIVDNALNGIVLSRAEEVVGDAKSDDDLAKWWLDQPIARFEVLGTNGPCAALIGAPNKGPETSQGGQDFFVKDASRTAVLRAEQHEFSRMAMKRAEFVQAAEAAPAGSVGGAQPGGNDDDAGD